MSFVVSSRRRFGLFASLLLLAGLMPVVFAGSAQAQPVVTIMDIQGAGHTSPFEGVEVTTTGVVTAIAFNGFYVQDPLGDNDPDTSDGLFVFQFGGLPSVGDSVTLTDTVTEFVPGGCSTGNLSTTQMSFPTLVNNGPAALPAAVVIGSSGRVPPAVDVISSDEEPVNLQPSFCPGATAPSVFDPAADGIDFFESLEGMLVTVEDPVAVSATRTFNPFSSELFTLPNDGANIAPGDARTARGGINLQPDPANTGDQNPERVQIQFDPTLSGGASVPAITVGDRLDDVTGVVGYSFGNFEVNAIHQVTFTPGSLGVETTSLVGTRDEVSVASYNVLNLDPLSGDDAQRATLAGHIAHNLASPDVVALQEIQDNNGTVDDGTTDATLTLQALVDAVAAAGGPDYEFFDVAPVDGASGGAPGGNIRNAFLYNPERVDLVDFVSLTPDVLGDFGVSDVNAFTGTRDPLLATFKFRGKEFTVVNNHLTSRFGSTPVFGGPQPFVQAGETERGAQTEALNEVVDALLAAAHGNEIHASKAGRVIVTGDLNTMEFTDEITAKLPGTGGDRVLTNLIDGLSDDNVYTFNFEGNSQVLDHMLVTDNLAELAKFDIVHVNVDFPRVSSAVGSDHEPLVGLFDLNGVQGPPEGVPPGPPAKVPVKNAGQRNFVANLSGGEEVGPVDTKARGVAKLQLNLDGDELAYRINVANIDNVVAVHIHCAPTGLNGAVGVTLFAGGPTGRVGGTLAEGVVTGPDGGNGCGWADLAAVAAAMRAGNTYINVHTTDVPSGEIRGQLS